MSIGFQRLDAQDVVASYQTFYDGLSPYGQWISDPDYGNVWVPNEAPGFRPYGTNGYWAMTDYGNMWVSDAPYGWATYHYGRWTYNPYYGWVWLPGHEWAPAWVTWRSGGGYYGWAPMGPGYQPGMVYEYPDNYWIFVGPEHLYSPGVYSYYEPRRTGWYIGRTSYINETYVDNGNHVTYYYGPRREVIERETNQPVQVYRVSNAREVGAPGIRGSEISVYRPAVSQESMRTARPENVRPAPQPIGRPQEISRNDAGRAPQFHQEMQHQNQGYSNPGNGGSRGNFGGQQQNQNVNQRPQNNRFESSPGANNFQQPRPQQNDVSHQQQPQNQPNGGYHGNQQQGQPAQPQNQQQMNRQQPQTQQNRQPANNRQQAQPNKGQPAKQGNENHGR